MRAGNRIDAVKFHPASTVSTKDNLFNAIRRFSVRSHEVVTAGAPGGGVINIELKVKLTVEPLLVMYKMGRPGIPRKAEFPTAAPVHDGAVVDTAAVAAVLVARRLNDKREPSLRVNEKFCPAEERAVVSL